MTATSTQRSTPSSGVVPARASVPIAANTLCLQGTIAVADANGRAANVGAGLNAIGVYSHTYDNRTTSRSSSGAAGEINAEIEFGEFELPYTGTAPEMGQVLFNVDNQTVSVDSSGGTRGVAGFAVQPADTDASTVRLYIGPHVSGAYADVAAVDSKADEALADTALLAAVEIPVPLGSFCLAAGTPLPAFGDGTATGFNLADSEGFGIRFNPSIDVALAAIWASVKLPDDIDDTAPIAVHFRAARIGALDTTVVLTCTAFRNRAGVAYDAGNNLSSGSTAAIAGATKVAADGSVTLTGAEAGDNLSISVVPSAALDADDLLLLACWITASRTLSA